MTDGNGTPTTLLKKNRDNIKNLQSRIDDTLNQLKDTTGASAKQEIENAIVKLQQELEVELSWYEHTTGREF